MARPTSELEAPYTEEQRAALRVAAGEVVAERRRRREAQATVRATLLAVLPPGVPPSFLEIAGARFEGSGRDRTIVATLVMFDGQTATVRLTRWSMGWSHQFTRMPGGACSFENGQWTRCP